MIVADGGDAAVLEWARRLREGSSTRPGVTTIGIGGLEVPEAVAVLAARIDGPS
ncbi:hypothetical protein [Nocardioides sp. P5_C9_2]